MRTAAVSLAWVLAVACLPSFLMFLGLIYDAVRWSGWDSRPSAWLSYCAGLVGCASAPKLSSIKGTLPPLSSDQARIYFYRAYRFGEAYQPEVTVNGQVVGKAQMEAVFFRDYPPAKYKISTSMAQGKHLVLDLAAGETKYVRLTYRIGFDVYP